MGYRQLLLICRNSALRTYDFNRRQGSDLDLFFVIGKRLLSKSQGFRLNPYIFISEHQVPVNILDLIDCRYGLQAKGHVGNFAVVSSDTNKAPIGCKPEALKQMLRDSRTKSGIQKRAELAELRTGSLARIVEADV